MANHSSMCVCVYIYIYIYTHTHTHTHTQFQASTGGLENEYPLWIRKSHCIMMMIHNFTDEKTKKSYRKVAPDDRVNG